METIHITPDLFVHRDVSPGSWDFPGLLAALAGSADLLQWRHQNSQTKNELSLEELWKQQTEAAKQQFDQRTVF